MVSTRSQSHLSGSSLQTGQDKNADLAAGEVTSKEAARPTRRAGRQLQQPGPASLEVIAEEGPSKTGRKKPTHDAKHLKSKEDASIDGKMIDKVADNIFAALEDGFGSCSDSLDSENTDDDGDGSDDEQGIEYRIKEKNLHWIPNLPGFDLAPLGGKSSRKQQQDDSLAGPSNKTSSKDLLEGKRGANLSKHLQIPSSDNRTLLRAAKKSAPDTAGKAWYDLPATTITDEVKNDLRVLRLRSALDPKTFYKKFDTTKFPKYFQFGTVVEGAAEFYSSRLADRKSVV